MSETRYSFCRLCPAMCGIRVEVEGDRAIKVVGDKDNPSTYGYTCKKGRTLPEQHSNPERLLRPVRRRADGTHETIGSAEALDEVAAKLREIVDRHGPNAVAIYAGTFQMMVPIGQALGKNFLHKLGSSMWFCSGTIDQPGKPVAAALHGGWEAGGYPFDHSDRWMLLGANPLVSMWGGLSGFNPARSLKQAKDRGLKLIVVDPRRSECADQADIHLQIRPGEDPTLLAGMVRLILDEALHDQAFVAEQAEGLDRLRNAVAPFTVDYVSRRCDIPEALFIEATRLLASGTRGGPSVGTGPNMAGRGTLTEYLALVLHTLLGRWVKEGEPVFQPNALLPLRHPRAQPSGPMQAWGFSQRLRTRDLGLTAAGLPTAALADEILTPGAGQIKALITLCGNPIAAWPDQIRAYEAMKSLDLLVSLDIKKTQTSKLAHYILPPPMALEVAGSSRYNELLYWYGVGNGYQKPFAQWSPPVVGLPQDSDLIEEWQVFYGLAQRLGLELEIPANAETWLSRPFPLDMEKCPTTEALFRAASEGSRVSLEEVMQYPHGHVFEIDLKVLPKDAENASRLQLGDPTMMADLATIANEAIDRQIDAAYPFRLISRRLRDFINSSGRDIPLLTRNGAFNPAFMNPEDLQELGLTAGDEVEITSTRARIFGIVAAEEGLRRGVVSMTHGFGDTPEFDGAFRSIGSPTGRLIDNTKDFDPITGIPRMSAIAVRISRLEASRSAA